MERYWYCYLPLHVAGSGGNTFVGKVRATLAEVREAWADCATIDERAATVHFYSRPTKKGAR